ncbi:MAG TPA: hypothetical protein VNI77_10130, partial [Nitrososphaera sp.]|nr:hypothetical protein [Nitrososphaera sp.]
AHQPNEYHCSSGALLLVLGLPDEPLKVPLLSFQVSLNFIETGYDGMGTIIGDNRSACLPRCQDCVMELRGLYLKCG